MLLDDVSIHREGTEFSTIGWPRSEPNSGPAYVQIFSRQFTVKYVLWMSQAITCNPLRDAMSTMILTKSQDTTEE